ncbi:MAG: glycosyltransferase family 4 protein [Myxococcota bacterium]
MPPTVLMVSKPIAPPWNDSGKNLVRDLARHGSRYGYRLLTTRAYAEEKRRAPPNGASHLTWEPLYPTRGSFTPALGQNLRVLARLLARDDADIRHFFFAPNPRTVAAARVVQRLRRTRTVQTVMSAPREGLALAKLLFADRIVALSAWSRSRLIDAGIDAERIALIPPGIALPPRSAAIPRRDAASRARHGLGAEPVVLFAGDYEFSHAARTLADAIPLVLARARATFLFACRLKTPAARTAEARVRERVRANGSAARVVFRNDVDDMPSLAGACDLCVMPAESLYAKMDLPLVLLEAMARGTPVVVAGAGPLGEVVAGGGGVAVPPRDPAALARALGDLLLDGDARARMGEEARRVAEARFDAREAARLHEALYDEMMEIRQ